MSSKINIDLEALERLCAAATPGPWEARPTEVLAANCRCLSCWESDLDRWVVDSGDRDLTASDSQFIAAARTAVPALVSEVRRLRARVVEMEEILERRTPKVGPGRVPYISPTDLIPEDLGDEEP